MQALIESIFGVYKPLSDAAGNIIPGVSGINFTWIAGVLCFLVLLISFFKLVGVLLKR